MLLEHKSVFQRRSISCGLATTTLGADIAAIRRVGIDSTSRAGMDPSTMPFLERCIRYMSDEVLSQRIKMGTQTPRHVQLGESLPCLCDTNARCAHLSPLALFNGSRHAAEAKDVGRGASTAEAVCMGRIPTPQRARRSKVGGRSHGTPHAADEDILWHGHRLQEDGRSSGDGCVVEPNGLDSPSANARPTWCARQVDCHPPGHVDANEFPSVQGEGLASPSR